MKKQIHHCAAMVLAGSVLLCSNHASADSEEWDFSVAPLYLWGKSIEGTASAGGMDIPLDLDFQDDILENLDAAFAIHFEATKGNLVLFAEYNYANLDPTVKSSLGPISIEAEVDFKDTMWEVGAGWAFADTGSIRWEVLGGLRYFKQDIKVKVSSSLPVELPLPNSVSVGDSWAQPFAGVRLTARMSERWSFRARGDYGYESDENTALQGTAMFDYRFRDWGSAFVGYRYLDIDYETDGVGLDAYAFDGDQQGPLIGINLYF